MYRIHHPGHCLWGAYPFLKGKFYDKYDMNYSALPIFIDWDSPLIATARNIYQQILKFVTEDPKQIATLYLDNMQALLKNPMIFLAVCRMAIYKPMDQKNL